MYQRKGKEKRITLFLPSRWSRIAFPFLFVLLYTLVFSFGIGGAVEYDIKSRSYLYLKENAWDEHSWPLSEQIDMNINKMMDGKLSFSASGRLTYDSGTSYGDRAKDEFTYGYLSFTPLEDRRLVANAGRVYVFGGVATEHLDGLSFRWAVTPYTGFFLFTGRPIITGKPMAPLFGGKKPDFSYGARVYQKIEDKAEAGLSYLKQNAKGGSFREELGPDLWTRPFNRVEVEGHSFYNNEVRKWMDHSYNLRIFPTKNLIVSGLFSSVDYKAAFYGATTTAFMPEYLKDDEMKKAGPSVEYGITDNVSVIADYARYWYNINGDASRFGGKVKGDLYGFSLGAGIHRMAGDTTGLKYTEYRAYTLRHFGELEAVIDIFNVHYDEPYNGVKNDFSFRGTLAYNLTKSLSASATLDYGKTPDLNRELSAFLKLTYNFGKVTGSGDKATGSRNSNNDKIGGQDSNGAGSRTAGKSIDKGINKPVNKEGRE